MDRPIPETLFIFGNSLSFLFLMIMNGLPNHFTDFKSWVQGATRFQLYFIHERERKKTLLRTRLAFLDVFLLSVNY